MKFYYFPIAPNPTRVRVFIREKGIDLDEVLVNLPEGEQNSAEHLARNPRGALPVLELDDGTTLTESVPIMEYLEELHPSPALIGEDALQRARTRELERLAELKVLIPIVRCVHATNSPLGLPPNPVIAEMEQARLPQGLALFDEMTADRPFVQGDAPTMVDCTLFAGLYFAEFGKLEIPDQYANLLRWYEDFKQRPSAQP